MLLNPAKAGLCEFEASLAYTASPKSAKAVTHRHLASKKCCLAFLLDPFPSRSKTVCHAVGQMATDFVCGFQKELTCGKAEKPTDTCPCSYCSHSFHWRLQVSTCSTLWYCSEMCVPFLYLSFKSWVNSQYLLHAAWVHMWWIQHWTKEKIPALVELML